MAERARVAIVQTHPIQYMAPWFRWMTMHEPDLDVTVLFAVEPTASAQASGFGGRFQWSLPLRDGYVSRVLSPEPWDGPLDGSSFREIPGPGLDAALDEIRPDAVVVPGWHARVYQEAVAVSRRRGWPVIYRGDSTRASGRRGLVRLARRAVTRRRLSRFDAFLAVGTRSRDYLLAHGAVDPLIFPSPHAVDNAFFANAAPRGGDAERRAIRDRFCLRPDRPVVLMAGKLQPKKRPLDVIRAVARLQPAAQLLVAGRGPLDEACRGEAARLGVTAVFAGFLQPPALAEAYAAADVLALASDADETWGLVVNEALASGCPVVVSDEVGCAPDLVGDDTGAVFRGGDVDALARALRGVLDDVASGRDYAPACRARAERHGFAEATAGLRSALARLSHRRTAAVAPRRVVTGPRVVACCGGMVTPGGLERMTFAVLAHARTRGVPVHCIVNRWGSRRIVDLADGIGASWSTGYYWYRLERRVWRPTVAARMAWDVLWTSAGLVRDARRHRATVVLLPEYPVVLRNLPALWWLRATGVRLVHRLGTAPEPGSSYRRLWRWVVAPVSHALVCNSRFTARALEAHGVPRRKIRIVENTLPPDRWARLAALAPRPVRGRILFVGQTIPGKGLHVLIEAVARLAASGHDVTLDVAGEMDGWESPAWTGYRDGLRRQVEAGGLTGRVRFLGWIDDVGPALEEASVLAVPSLPEIREGFGLVVLEAKAAGVPALVSRSGALPDLVEHGVDGWVATTVTAEAVAEGLAVLLDPARRDRASAAARRSAARFDPERFARQWHAALTGEEPIDCAGETRA